MTIKPAMTATTKASIIIGTAILIHAMIVSDSAGKDRAFRQCEDYLAAVRSGDTGATVPVGVAQHNQQAIYVAEVVAATLKLSKENRAYCQFPAYTDDTTGLDMTGDALDAPTAASASAR